MRFLLVILRFVILIFFSFHVFFGTAVAYFGLISHRGFRVYFFDYIVGTVTFFQRAGHLAFGIISVTKCDGIGRASRIHALFTSPSLSLRPSFLAASLPS